MARPTNKKSKRQQIFTHLDGLSNLKRFEVVAILIKKFGITESYARSLYQSHRQDRSKKQSGNEFITIYKVRDIRSNVPVDPYMSSMVKNNPEETEAKSEIDAIKIYRKDSVRKSNLALVLSNS